MSGEAESELVARAVATELSSAGLGLTFVFDPNPDIDLKDLAAATLAHVRDVDEQSSYACRTMTQHDYSIEICLRRKVASDVSVFIKDLKLTLQTIAEFYRFKPSVSGRTERFVQVGSRQIMDDKAIKDMLVMKAILVLIFRGWRT